MSIFEKKYFFGDQKIKDSKKVSRSVGDVKEVEYIELELQNGKKVLVLARNARNVILTSKTDATELRANKCKKAIEEIAQVFFEYNLNWSEYPFVIQNLNKALEDSERMAATNLWGKKELEITFLDIFDRMDAQRKLESGEIEAVASAKDEKNETQESPQETPKETSPTDESNQSDDTKPE